MAEPAVNPAARKRAPTYYGIITIKLVKGLFFVLVALGVFSLVGDDLPAELDRLLRWANVDPETRLFAFIANYLSTITPSNVRWVASGTLLYGLLSLGEGIGLIFRLRWVGWLVILESALLIPYEVYHFVLGRSLTVTVILFLNVGIVWYLIQNRNRLFRPPHPRRHHHQVEPPPAAISRATTTTT